MNPRKTEGILLTTYAEKEKLSLISEFLEEYQVIKCSATGFSKKKETVAGAIVRTARSYLVASLAISEERTASLRILFFLFQIQSFHYGQFTNREFDDSLPLGVSKGNFLCCMGQIFPTNWKYPLFFYREQQTSDEHFYYRFYIGVSAVDFFQCTYRCNERDFFQSCDFLHGKTYISAFLIGYRPPSPVMVIPFTRYF